MKNLRKDKNILKSLIINKTILYFDIKSYFSTRTKKMIALALIIFFIGSFLIYFFPTPEPENPQTIKGDENKILHFFEIGGITAFVLSIIHALRRWDKKEVFIFFTSCFLFAFLFEDMNIQLTNDYAYNKNAWLVFHHTMLVIVFSWCAIAYSLVLTINSNLKFKNWNPIEKGILAGFLALTIDLGIDATAFAYGLWFWSEGYFFGVPITNFVGWFSAIFWFVFSTEYLREKGRNWNFNKQLKYRIFSIFPDYFGLVLIIGFVFACLFPLGIR